MVLRYNLSLLGPGGLAWLQYFYKCVPSLNLMMIGPISTVRDSQLVPDVHPRYWLPLFFVGMFIAVVNNNITSLPSIALSLSRKNVDFLKVYLDFARYVKVEILDYLFCPVLLPILTLLGLSYFGLPILSMIYLLVAWGSLPVSAFLPPVILKIWKSV